MNSVQLYYYFYESNSLLFHQLFYSFIILLLHHYNYNKNYLNFIFLKAISLGKSYYELYFLAKR